MPQSKVQGLCSRRIILNWRVNPDSLQKILPAPFRPKLVEENGIVGICIIELEEMRPKGMPAFVGMRSINAAPRIAVEWPDEDKPGQFEQGVYIPRRYTSAKWNAFVSKLRFFPTASGAGDIEVEEDEDGKIQAHAVAPDGMKLSFSGHTADRLDDGSVFKTTQEASDFLKAAQVAYSPNDVNEEFDAIKLKTYQWEAAALSKNEAECTFISDNFKGDEANFDSALIMRGIAHEWHYLGCGSPCEFE